MTEYVICPFSKPECTDRLISSIARQERKGSKAVIVENGPAVGSFPRMEGVTILRSDAHQSAAKNVGLKWVREEGGGRWSVLDCDDYYGPGYLEDQMLALDSGFDMAGKSYGSLMYIMFDDGLYLDGTMGSSEPAGFLNGGATSCSTAEVPDFPMTQVGEDGEWYKMMMKRGARALNTGARHYCYDRTGSGHTWDPGEKAIESHKKRMLHLGSLPWETCDIAPRKIVGGGQSVAKVVMLHTEDYSPAEVAVPDMRRYCRLWGYDLHAHSRPVRTGWPSAWDKLPAVVEAMESVGYGEWVLWMDCDMLMLKIRSPLEEMVSPSKDFMVSVDGNGICTGFFFIRNVPLMRAFMSDLMKDMRPDWPWEQDVAKEIITARPDYAGRVGHIPESLVQNPASVDSVHAIVMHYWGNSYPDKEKLLNAMRKEIRVRDEVGGRHVRPWMKRV